MNFLFEYNNYFDSNLHINKYLLKAGVWERKSTWGFDEIYMYGNGFEEKSFARKYDTNLIFNL